MSFLFILLLFSTVFMSLGRKVKQIDLEASSIPEEEKALYKMSADDDNVPISIVVLPEITTEAPSSSPEQGKAVKRVSLEDNGAVAGTQEEPPVKMSVFHQNGHYHHSEAKVEELRSRVSSVLTRHQQGGSSARPSRASPGRRYSGNRKESGSSPSAPRTRMSIARSLEDLSHAVMVKLDKLLALPDIPENNRSNHAGQQIGGHRSPATISPTKVKAKVVHSTVGRSTRTPNISPSPVPRARQVKSKPASQRPKDTSIHPPLFSTSTTHVASSSSGLAVANNSAAARKVSPSPSAQRMIDATFRSVSATPPKLDHRQTKPKSNDSNKIESNGMNNHHHEPVVLSSRRDVIVMNISSSVGVDGATSGRVVLSSRGGGGGRQGSTGTIGDGSIILSPKVPRGMTPRMPTNPSRVIVQADDDDDDDDDGGISAPIPHLGASSHNKRNTSPGNSSGATAPASPSDVDTVGRENRKINMRKGKSKEDLAAADEEDGVVTMSVQMVRADERDSDATVVVDVV